MTTWNTPEAIPGDVKQLIRIEAEKAAPNECCGLIIRAGNKFAIHPCRNISQKPMDYFHADPEDVAAAEDAGEVLMSYHSHTQTGPTASDADKTDAERNERPSLIVSWPVDSWTLYVPNGWRAPLVGRVFVHGVLDCYTLTRDFNADPSEYLPDEAPILLPDFERPDDWWKVPGQDLYMDNFTACGYSVAEDLKPMDILLIQMPGSEVANHSAVYLGDGHIIHHPPNRLSGVAPYVQKRSYYHQATRAIIRHESRR